MEIATLTAVLEAQIAGFQTNMRAADVLLNQLQRQIGETEVDVVKLAKAMEKIDIANSQIAHVVSNLKVASKELGATRADAEALKRAIADISIPDSAVAKNAANAALEVRSLKDIRNAALEAALAEQRVQGRNYGGQFTSSRIPMGPARSNNSQAFTSEGFAQNIISDFPRGPFGVPGRKTIIIGDVSRDRAAFFDGLRRDMGRFGLFGQEGQSGIQRIIKDMRRRFNSEGGLFGTGGMFGKLSSIGGGANNRGLGSQLLALAPGGRRATGAGLAIGISAATPLVSSLLPAVGVLATLPAIATGGIAMLGGLATAFDGVTKALGGNLQEYQGLNADAKKFVDLIRGPVSEAVSGIGKTTSKMLFPGLDQAIKEIFNPTTIKVFNQVLGQGAYTLGQIAAQIGKVFQNKDFLSTFQMLATAGMGFWQQMATAAIQFGKALGDIGIAALPLLRWMGDMTVEGAQFLSQWTGSHAQAMGSFFGQTEKAVSVLFRTVGNLLKILFSLMEALRPLGNYLFSQLNPALKKLNDWLEDNRKTIGIVTVLIARDLVNAVKVLWAWLMAVVNDVLKPSVEWLIKMGHRLSEATDGWISLTHAAEALVALAVVDWITGVSVALLTKLLPAIIAVATSPAVLTLIAVAGLIKLISATTAPTNMFKKVGGTYFRTIPTPHGAVDVPISKAAYEAGIAQFAGSKPAGSAHGGGGGLGGPFQNVIDSVNALAKRANATAAAARAVFRRTHPHVKIPAFLSGDPADPFKVVGTPGAGVLSPGLATSIANAQGAAASGSLPALKAELAAEQKGLAYLKDHVFAAKQAVQAAKERAVAEKQILAIQEKIHQLELSGKIDKILGIGRSGLPGSQSFRFRERSILLDVLERQVGGKKHTLGVAAAALGLTPSQLENEPLAKLMKQLKDNGLVFNKETLRALHRINDVLEITRKDHLKLTPDEKTKIGDMLTQIRDTLKANISNTGTSYVRVTPESIVNSIPGLTLAQKLALEQSIAQAQGHRMHRPTGGAAAGIALPGSVIVHGDIVIQSSARNIDELAREIRQKLLKTQRRNATQTRGPNAGRAIGLN